MTRLQVSFRTKIVVAAAILAAISGCFATNSISDSKTDTGEQFQGEQVSDAALADPAIGTLLQANKNREPDPEIVVDVGTLRFSESRVGKLTLYSLKCDFDYAVEPEKLVADERENFHGLLVLGKVDIKDAPTQRRILEALDKSKAQGDGIAKCFYPRHGVRVVDGGRETDYLVCFQCSWLQTFLDGKLKTEAEAVSRYAQPLFNQVLDDAKIPVMSEARD